MSEKLCVTKKTKCVIGSMDANDVFSFVSEGAKTLYKGRLAPQTEKSSGIDLIVSEVEIRKDSQGGVSYILVKTGLRLNPHFDVPHTRVEVHPRSSLFKNTGLVMVNSTGIVDNDYEGEIMCQLAPLRDGVIIVPQVGERVAQATLVSTIPWAARGANKRDGGFGSTGTS